MVTASSAEAIDPTRGETICSNAIMNTVIAAPIDQASIFAERFSALREALGDAPKRKFLLKCEEQIQEFLADEQ